MAWSPEQGGCGCWSLSTTLSNTRCLPLTRTIISSYAKQEPSSVNNNNSCTNETLAFNVLLSSVSFAEDRKMLYFKRSIIKVVSDWTHCEVQVVELYAPLLLILVYYNLGLIFMHLVHISISHYNIIVSSNCWKHSNTQQTASKE